MAFDNLKNSWTNRINAQYASDGDDINYESAKVNLDFYITALNTESSIIGDDTQSYTIGGQSVTKYKPSNIKATSQHYLMMLQRYVGRNGITVDDFRTNYI